MRDSAPNPFRRRERISLCVTYAIAYEFRSCAFRILAYFFPVMHSHPSPQGGWLALPLIALASFGSVASAQSLSPLSTYNVVVSGNLSTSSDIEGRTIVGGNITSSNSANFGIRLQNQVPKTDMVLRVGGNIAAGNPIQLNAGSLELGGSRNNRIINFNGGGSLVSNPGVSFNGIIDDLTLASQNLATYGANSNAMLISNGVNQPGPFRMTASPDSSGLSVFSVNASDDFWKQPCPANRAVYQQLHKHRDQCRRANR